MSSPKNILYFNGMGNTTQPLGSAALGGGLHYDGALTGLLESDANGVAHQIFNLENADDLD